MLPNSQSNTLPSPKKQNQKVERPVITPSGRDGDINIWSGRRNGERLYEADITSSRAVLATSTHSVAGRCSDSHRRHCPNGCGWE